MAIISFRASFPNFDNTTRILFDEISCVKDSPKKAGKKMTPIIYSLEKISDSF